MCVCAGACAHALPLTSLFIQIYSVLVVNEESSLFVYRSPEVLEAALLSSVTVMLNGETLPASAHCQTRADERNPVLRVCEAGRISDANEKRKVRVSGRAPSSHRLPLL